MSASSETHSCAASSVSSTHMLSASVSAQGRGMKLKEEEEEEEKKKDILLLGAIVDLEVGVVTGVGRRPSGGSVLTARKFKG
jgi:hypothetical protein